MEKENILAVAKGEGWVKEEIQGGGYGQKRVGSTWGALWWQNYYASCLQWPHESTCTTHTKYTHTNTPHIYTQMNARKTGEI